MCLELLYAMNLRKVFVIPFLNIGFEALIYY